MGKRQVVLYGDDELIILAKEKGINMSRFFTEILRTELQFKELSDTTTKEDLMNKLKSTNALLKEEINLLNEKLLLKDKEIKELNTKLLEQKERKEKKKTFDDGCKVLYDARR
jgi:hypothetical protein